MSPSELWTVAQAAAFLHCAPTTIRRLARARKIPFCQPVHQYLFDPAELAQWVRETGRRVTLEELQARAPVGASVGALMGDTGTRRPQMTPHATGQGLARLAAIRDRVRAREERR